MNPFAERAKKRRLEMDPASHRRNKPHDPPQAPPPRSVLAGACMTLHDRSGTIFRKLNDGWNAEPNAPHVHTKVCGTDLILRFNPNPWEFPAYVDVRRIEIAFHQ